MGLSVTVLGCSGTYASAGNACSGYLVRSDSTAVWLDTGPGTLANVQRHVALTDLAAVVVTHSHPDHWLELPVLRNALRFVFEVEGMRVMGTDETRRLADLVTGGTAPTFAWETIADGAEATVGDLSLRFSRTDHPVETLAVRVDHAGTTLGYTADTGPGWSLTALDPDGTGFDLALCEATLGPEQEDRMQHCSARQAAEMAKDAGVRRLVLTHLMAGTEESRLHEAKAVFDGSLSTATIHERYDL